MTGSGQPAYTELDLIVGTQDSSGHVRSRDRGTRDRGPGTRVTRVGGGGMQDYGLVTETTLTMDDFQTLASESQSDQIFKLLAILSPLANEVCDLKCNIGEMLGRHGVDKKSCLSNCLKVKLTFNRKELLRR